MNAIKNIDENRFLEKINILRSKSCFSEIAGLLTCSLQENTSQFNRRVFKYIPSLFREIPIKSSTNGINHVNLIINEPVIYKIDFPSECTMGQIPYFYMLCYLKESCHELNIYFQSASAKSISLNYNDYNLSKQTIAFEGIISAFTNNFSVISISDPGHFIPGLTSSFYVGTKDINFAQLISNIIESICLEAQISLADTLLVGSSAGGMGALLTSSYASSKTHVLAVNSQINTYGLSKVMQSLLGITDQKRILEKFGDRVCCKHRFQQNLNSIPNIYLLSNVRDNLHKRNYDFYELYQKLYSSEKHNNQSIFDSYYGVEGHGRPDKASLKEKIKIARVALTMQSNPISELNQHHPEITTKTEKIVRNRTIPIKIAKLNQRRKIIEKAVDISQIEILEIGAFDNPTFSKDEFKVSYCDYFSNKELIKNHSVVKPQRLKNAVDVDYVVKDSFFIKHIEKKFDLIVANHVIEHIPNMIEWLHNISLILKKNGFLFLTLPHKEYTFDKLRCITNLRELVRNYHENIKAPTIHHVFDQLYYHRPIKAENVWNNNYNHLLLKQRFGSAEDALNEAKKRLNNNIYVDVHCNVFTYESFLDIVNEMEKTRFTTLSLYLSQNIIEPYNEFYVLLKNS